MICLSLIMNVEMKSGRKNNFRMAFSRLLCSSRGILKIFRNKAYRTLSFLHYSNVASANHRAKREWRSSSECPAHTRARHAPSTASGYDFQTKLPNNQLLILPSTRRISGPENTERKQPRYLDRDIRLIIAVSGVMFLKSDFGSSATSQCYYYYYYFLSLVRSLSLSLPIISITKAHFP